MDRGSKIYVAGHRGMVGSAVVRALNENGFERLIVRTHKELDLTDQAAVRDFFATENPDIVVGFGRHADELSGYTGRQLLVNLATDNDGARVKQSIRELFRDRRCVLGFHRV